MRVWVFALAALVLLGASGPASAADRGRNGGQRGQRERVHARQHRADPFMGRGEHRQLHRDLGSGGVAGRRDFDRHAGPNWGGGGFRDRGWDSRGFGRGGFASDWLGTAFNWATCGRCGARYRGFHRCGYSQEFSWDRWFEAPPWDDGLYRCRFCGEEYTYGYLQRYGHRCW